MNAKQLLTAFVLGGVYISLGDRSHIAFGVLSQVDTSFFGQAWWVPPMFGAVSISLIQGLQVIRRLLGEETPERSPVRLTVAAIAFLVVYSLTGPLGGGGVPLAAVLTLLWVVRLVIWRERRSTIILCLLIAALGPLGEWIVSALGFFSYANPDLLGLPVWLPAVYLHGGLVVPLAEAELNHQFPNPE